MVYAQKIEVLLGIALAGHGKGNILCHRHVWKKGIVLREEANFSGLRRGLRIGLGFVPAIPLKIDISAVNRLKPCQTAQDRCFSRSGGTSQNDRLPGFAGNGDREFVEWKFFDQNRIEPSLAL